jgi:hypothetical protein
MKKIFSILAIVLLLTGFLANSGCKKKTDFDIRGTWYFTLTLLGDDYDYVYDFIGDRGSGDVLWEGLELGTYSVSGDIVNITMEYYDQDDDYTVEVYRGYFDSDSQMSGSMTITVEGYQSVSGSWYAVR